MIADDEEGSMDLTIIKKNYNRFGIIYLIGSLTVNLLITCGMAVADHISPSLRFRYDQYFLIQMGIRFLIGYPIFILLIRRMKPMKIPQHRFGFGKLLAAFIMTYSLGLVSNVLGLGVTLVVTVIRHILLPGVPGGGFDMRLVEMLTQLNPAFGFLFTVILAPIFEELLFRKLLIDRIYGYGELTAILLSGLMFGLYHGNLQQFVYASTLGCCFAYIYLRTGRIRYTMILHGMINSVGTLLGAGLLKNIDLKEYMESVASGNMSRIMAFLEKNSTLIMTMFLMELVIFALVITGIVLWIVTLAQKKLHLVHYIHEVPRGKGFSVAFLNPGVLLFFLIYTGMILYRLLFGIMGQ